MPSSYNRATSAIDAFTTGTLTGVVSGSDHGNKADALNKIEAQLVKEAPINVKWPDFGAVGNGSTDDTAAIQAAIAALPSGGRLFFPVGVYKLTSTLTLDGHFLEGEVVSQDGPTATLQHSFNGDMISLTAGSKGGGAKNLLLNQVSTNTGAAIKAASTAGSVSGYHYFENLIITGGSGWERDVYLDGSAHASGIRSVFFKNCLFFGCTTVGETVLLKKPIHVYFDACDMSQSPAAVQQGVKITDVVSEDVQWTGKVLGDWSTEAAGAGVWFLGHISGTITCQSGAANNKFYGRFPGTYTNSGGSGNYRADASPAVRVKKTAVQTLSNATLTAIAFDAEDFDTETIHDNSTNNTRLTVRTAGKYHIYGTIVFVANTTGERAIAFKKNGGTYLGGDARGPNPTGANQTCVSASTTADLAAGDYVECMGEQISSGSLDVSVSSSSIGVPTHFGMERVG